MATLTAEMPERELGSIEQTVRDGLTASPKHLPPWLLYDAAGSALFDEITRLPEYYLTRMERALLAEHAPAMIAATLAAEPAQRPAGPLRILELGAGSADKTRLLLAAALDQPRVRYQPVDVCVEALEAARERLAEEQPAVETLPIACDYTAEWLPEPFAGRTLLAWIGSSIGNFEPAEATAMLARMAAALAPGDGLLLGVDLAPSPAGKSVAELVAAYDDRAGVTAAFNRNLLTRLNRELGADFDLERFRHVALWNATASRMEMHLESERSQRVRIPALDLTVAFAAAERLHTENSYKYTIEGAKTLMAAAGFADAATWVSEGWFALLLGRRA